MADVRLVLNVWPVLPDTYGATFCVVEGDRGNTMRRSNVGWIAIGLAFVVVVSLAAEGGFASGHRNPDHGAPTSDAHGPALTRHRLLVGLAPGGTLADLAHELHHQHGQVLDRIGPLGVVELCVPLGRLHAASRAFGSLDAVSYVEREGRAYASDVIPNDPYFPWTGSNVIYGGQWGDGLTQAQKAWDVTTGSPSVIVAVVDSGIDDAHPDLAGQLVPGASMVGGSTIATESHGEYVAGVIAPNTNNGVGVAGYCWSCKLMPVKITNTSSATYSDMASGIVWATDHGARVINVSYAGTTNSSTLNSAVSYATNHGAIVVAAAGNSGCNCITYPAASPGAIAVAASDQFDNLMSYSNFGSWVQVAAPTGDVTTWLTVNGNPYGYGPVGGTSISAPVVSGILALMISLDPSASVSELKDALFSSVDPITGLTQGGSPVSVQYGRVNASKALLAMGAAGPSVPPSPAPSSSPAPSPSSSPTPTGAPTSTSSAIPSPSPSDTSSTTAAPSPQTVTFSGSLNAKNPTKSFPVTLLRADVLAQLSFKRCASLDLALLDPTNAQIGEHLGPSVVTLESIVEAGNYVYVVSGGKCNFTLTVSETS